jgi:cleavage and polyadenylation specificity factor subunit 6/7
MLPMVSNTIKMKCNTFYFISCSVVEYASAIETLVTAISLIRGSKVGKERRCQILICSLQESLEGIEHRSYGSRNSSKNKSTQT